MEWVEQSWDVNGNGMKWDDYKLEAKYETPLSTWKAQVHDTKRYISTERERIAAQTFTTYAMTVKLGREFDAGLCMISDRNGAVCLMRSRDEIDTYRLDNEEWANVARQPTSAAAVQAIKDSNGLQSAFRNDAVMWMDEWYCSEDGFAGYLCTSFMPAWQSSGIYEPGYPRFGIQESEEGEFTYAMLANDSSRMQVKDLIINGAAALATGCAAMFFLGF